MSKLSTADHQKVFLLGLQCQKGTGESKQVFICDQLVAIVDHHLLNMRLHPDEVGIHPQNRDSDEITSEGVCIRGRKIIASGFPCAAIGTLYAFEDHPTDRTLTSSASLILAILKSAPRTGRIATSS